MQEEELKDLLNRYRSGDVTDTEKAFLESWYLKYEDPDSSEYSVSDRIQDANAIWLRLADGENKELPSTSLWPRIAVAALVLVVASFSLYFYLGYYEQTDAQHLVGSQKVEVVPGGNKATLTLADGRKISLTDAKIGELAKQAGIVVSKTADGQLLYTISSASKVAGSMSYNTIETPRGGQYQVSLPDGSNVWLNAASSLKYPAIFGEKERKVELQGEAYFEIAEDKSKPFLVVSQNQTVEVLGTHFNISSYEDEPEIKTTLLEGSVKVSGKKGHKVIKPGEQTILSQNLFEISQADIEETMAWKNGYFRFNDEHIDDIMRKLSRWYNIEIQYDGKISEEGFSGVVSRSKNLSQVLKMLENTQAIHFKTEGRRIVVTQ